MVGYLSDKCGPVIGRATVYLDRQVDTATSFICDYIGNVIGNAADSLADRLVKRPR